MKFFEQNQNHVTNLSNMGSSSTFSLVEVLRLFPPEVEVTRPLMAALSGARTVTPPCAESGVRYFTPTLTFVGSGLTLRTRHVSFSSELNSRSSKVGRTCEPWTRWRLLSSSMEPAITGMGRTLPVFGSFSLAI